MKPLDHHRRTTIALGALATSLAASALVQGASATQQRVLFIDNFDRANGPNNLITNEYAFRNPNDPRAVRSPNWEATSGSLFYKRGVGITGVPDGCKPDRYSQVCNDSAVFRLRTRRTGFKNVTVSVRLLNHSLTSTSRTPARAIDGIHLWLRYQSEAQLYALSVNRRDGTVVIKKKCPGGPSNGGTYYTLASAKSLPIPFGTWQRVQATVQNGQDGSVDLRLSRDGTQLVEATDRGTGCAPITAAGRVGVRGDNDDFSIEAFTVTTP